MKAVRMPLELSLPYQLRTSDFDRFDRLKPASALDIFQDIASIQAEDMGIGYDRMASEGVFWAVARTKLEIVQNPAMHSVATARTWPHSPSRLFFQRDYAMTDADGNMVAKARSEWMLLNTETRTIESVLDHCDVDGDFCEDRMFADKVRRTKPFLLEEATEPLTEVVAKPSDADTNGHVNNACYAAYVLDVLDLGANEQIKTLQIDYRHEIRVGDRIQIAVKRDGKTILAQGMNGSDEASFTCEIVLA